MINGHAICIYSLWWTVYYQRSSVYLICCWKTIFSCAIGDVDMLMYNTKYGRIEANWRLCVEIMYLLKNENHE